MTKLTALTELTAVDPADLLYIVDDPAGTPTGKKATALNVVSDTLANAGAAIDFSDGITVAGGSNGIDASGSATLAGLNVDSNTLYVDAANNRVGIGTAAPSAWLHVSLATANPELRLTRTSGLTGDFSIISGGALSPSLRFYDRTNAAERITLIGNGSVGIGDTTPNGQLHVVNGTASQPAFIAQADESQADNIIEIQTSGGAIQFGIGVTGQILTNQDSANTNTPSGATAHQLPIYNEAGTLLGYIPVYASAW